jgi:hypothetical protein
MTHKFIYLEKREINSMIIYIKKLVSLRVNTKADVLPAYSEQKIYSSKVPAYSEQKIYSSEVPAYSEQKIYSSVLFGISWYFR